MGKAVTKQQNFLNFLLLFLALSKVELLPKNKIMRFFWDTLYNKDLILVNTWYLETGRVSIWSLIYWMAQIVLQ